VKTKRKVKDNLEKSKRVFGTLALGKARDANNYAVGYEELTNPKSARRWRDKKNAFSNEYLVKDEQ
jgi:hypothetical protein